MALASILLANIAIFSFFLFSVVVSFPTDAFDFGKEKKTHLHFYFQDVVSGPKPTAIPVAEAPSTNKSSTTFGRVFVADDRLTEGPELNSRLIGRAQGIYTLASQEEMGLLMVFNLVFVAGEHNGSTLTLVGRNAILSEVREMSIVGGSGKFRLGRGYALAKTYSFNLTSLDATVEWNVYVLHY